MRGKIQRWVPLQVVAEALCLPQRVLREMSKRGDFPPIVRTGPRTYRIAEEEVIAWQEEQIRKAEQAPERARRRWLDLQAGGPANQDLPDFLKWKTGSEDE